MDNLLSTCFEQEDVITLRRSALELYPQGEPQLGTLSDSFDEVLALERTGTALELRPHEHPKRTTSLAKHRALPLHCFRRLGTLSDLDEAVALGRNSGRPTGGS
ncbi:hypothetical protein HD554DRAFT_2174247 [Boletus coccyginus]|nr:hypothetical protein HD554DRAFT_2174247 [Boletus coccyginus]